MIEITSTGTGNLSREPITIWNAPALYFNLKTAEERTHRRLDRARTDLAAFMDQHRGKSYTTYSFEMYCYEKQVLKMENTITELRAQLRLLLLDLDTINSVYAEHELYPKSINK